MKKPSRVLLWTLFALYCVVMIWLLLGQRMGRRYPFDYIEQLRMNLNLIPFRTIDEFVTAMSPGSTASGFFSRFAFINLAGNVLMFVPLGVFLPALWPRLRRFGRFLLWVVLAVIAVELVQLFTLLGSCDIDDLILNTLGAVIGFAFYKLALMLYHRKRTIKDSEIE